MVTVTTLAPDIVAVILDDILTPDLTLFDLAVDPPALWEDAAFAYSSVPTTESYAQLAPNEISEEAVEVLNGLNC